MTTNTIRSPRPSRRSLLTVWLTVLLALVSTAARAAPDEAKVAEIRALIERLVNTGKPPKLEHHDMELAKGTDRDAIHKSHELVAAAYGELSDRFEIALPILVENANDKRYSHVYEHPNSGSILRVDVGQACGDLVAKHVEIYQQFTGGRYRPDRLLFIKSCGGVEAWWKARREKPLVELQIEAVEWAARQNRLEHKSVKSWLEVREKLAALAAELRRTGKPVLEKQELFFFGH